MILIIITILLIAVLFELGWARRKQDKIIALLEARQDTAKKQ